MIVELTVQYGLAHLCWYPKSWNNSEICNSSKPVARLAEPSNLSYIRCELSRESVWKENSNLKSQWIFK